MEIVKNGQDQVPAAARARIYQVTPDGSQWEVRVHLEADVGMGPEIIGEVVCRSYNGGITPLMGLVTEGARTASQLVAKVAKAMEEAQRRIVPATTMPPNMKN